MMCVQATHRAGPASNEPVDLTTPSNPGFGRRFGWAVAFVAAGAGLLGFVIGGLSEPGYTATAYVELSPETPVRPGGWPARSSWNGPFVAGQS